MRETMLNRAAAAGIAVTQAQAADFETYHKMLCAANAEFNLTAIPDTAAEAVDRNYLDCILPLKNGFPADAKNLIDVGSGAGFPGIPLAIMRRDIHIVLLDSLTKRVEFLKSVIDALHLNAEAIHMRAEDAARRADLRESFDVAAARAVAPLNLLCEYLLPFVRVDGAMLAYKGPSVDAEAEAAENALKLLGGRVERIVPVEIPGRDWDHRLCVIRKDAPTPEKYPRRAGKPEKKPL